MSPGHFTCRVRHALPIMAQAAIKGVRKVIARASDEDVAATLSEGALLQSLFLAFGHDVADVRKAVTFCLVDLRLVRSAMRAPSEAKHQRHKNRHPSLLELVCRRRPMIVHWTFCNRKPATTARGVGNRSVSEGVHAAVRGGGAAAVPCTSDAVAGEADRHLRAAG